VGTTVETARRRVDVVGWPRAVHVDAAPLRMTSGLSSTAARFFGTNVSGGPAPSSPVSTPAKTTDENLNSGSDNDKNDLDVDRVDGGVAPPTEREYSVRSECRAANSDRNRAESLPVSGGRS
jgi:hypothetical protein